MKKIGVLFGLFILAAFIAVAAVGVSGNYSPSNSAVEGNFPGQRVADGSPRPPLPPLPAFDGSPRPPIPPALLADGSPRPPIPPTLIVDGSPRPPIPPGSRLTSALVA
jgi:hypothetical protein